MDDHYFIMVNVYGFNNVIQNRQLILDVSSVIVHLKLIYRTAIIVVGGDFNMVSDESLDRIVLFRPYKTEIMTFSLKPLAISEIQEKNK